MLKLCTVVLIAHWVAFMVSGIGIASIHHKVQYFFNQHFLLAIPSHKLIILDQTNPQVKVLFKSGPVLGNFTQHHIR